MKFTKISPDKAHKLYLEGKGDTLYFKSFAAPFDNIRIPMEFDYYNPPQRYWFRQREMFIGTKLPKVTVRQSVEFHCTKGNFSLRDDVLKMLYIEQGGTETQYPISEDLAKKLDKARERTTKYILFDVDFNGEKSNFRFE